MGGARTCCWGHPHHDRSGRSGSDSKKRFAPSAVSAWVFVAGTRHIVPVCFFLYFFLQQSSSLADVNRPTSNTHVARSTLSNKGVQRHEMSHTQRNHTKKPPPLAADAQGYGALSRKRGGECVEAPSCLCLVAPQVQQWRNDLPQASVTHATWQHVNNSAPNDRCVVSICCAQRATYIVNQILEEISPLCSF